MRGHRNPLGLARLYLDAVKGMRARQLAWRATRLLPTPLFSVGTRTRPVSVSRPIAGRLGYRPTPQGGRGRPAHETGEITILGASRHVGAPGFWDDSGDGGLLFSFHLHGFVPLAEYVGGDRSTAGDAFWAGLIEDWLREHDRPSGSAWHAFPTSLRLIAWSSALSDIEWPPALRERLGGELLRQARYLRRRVEHDIGGNHVIKNATALAFVGALFPSTGFMRSALRLLERQTAAQVLADGGHEERSTSYHLEVLGDLADVRTLLERGRQQVPVWLVRTQQKMRAWLEALAGPDGMLPMLNDAWEGPAFDARERSPITALLDTGYVVLRDRRDQIVIDAGPLCPPHLPPHAHADALSFVLWGDGQQIVVDPGSFEYTGPERDYFRGTRAHNTVEVDGRDQCCFWGPFRAAFLPVVTSPLILKHEGVVIVCSSHDGYRRLADPVWHYRTVIWWPGYGLVILDRLGAERRHEIASRLHLAPGLSLEGGRVGPFEVLGLGDVGPIERERGRYSPFLGHAVPITTLVQRTTLRPGAVIGWQLLRPGAGVAEVEPSHLVLEAGSNVIRVPVRFT